jgi:CelD/BcsL family acetyltransferase involved in cellulose biosynthesis
VDQVSLAEVDARSDEVEDLVDRTPGADRWCSAPDWVLPAHQAFAPGTEPLVLAGRGSMACLARYETADGVPLLAGLEPLWGFACPLLGPDPGRSAAQLAAALARDPDWHAVALGGLPPDRAVLRAIADGLRTLGPARLGEGIVRQVADLDADVEGFWARRGSYLRRNVRRARRHAERVGLEVCDVSDQPDLHDRVVRIEQRSWKGRTGDGLASPEMAEFYRLQLGRLRRHGRVRALVARLDGVDVGFIVGGCRAGTYRGLQLSYAEEVRHLSVGHLLQAAELDRLAAEGVGTYDLGMDLDYKRAWADRAVASLTLLVVRGSDAGGRLR